MHSRRGGGARTAWPTVHLRQVVMGLLDMASSFNGRTADSQSADRGSTPREVTMLRWHSWQAQPPRKRQVAGSIPARSSGRTRQHPGESVAAGRYREPSEGSRQTLPGAPAPASTSRPGPPTVRRPDFQSGNRGSTPRRDTHSCALDVARPPRHTARAAGLRNSLPPDSQARWSSR